MRYVTATFFLVMLLFEVLQYNDPDGPFWMLAYGIPAAWAGLATVAPDRLHGTVMRSLLAGSLITFIAATFVFWPTTAGWWHTDVWWNDEPAREGMGLMLSTLMIAVVAMIAFSGRGRVRNRTAAGSLSRSAPRERRI